MNDEEYGTLLLRPLAGDPAGPARIDVPKAMRDGLRRRRRRWWSGGAGLLAAMVAGVTTVGLLLSPAGTQPQPKPGPVLPPEPTVPAACTMTQLPTGGNASVEVTAGDSTGRWHVGTAAPVYGATGPLLVWHDGKLVAKVSPPDGDAILNDVNASGVAVGGGNGDQGHPFVYRNGKTTQLQGGRGSASAIDDAGMIVGTLETAAGRKPVRWRSADAQPEPLPMPHDVQLIQFIRDIAPDGTIAGMSLGTTVIWSPDGSVRTVTLPGAPAFRATKFGFGWLYGEGDRGGVARYDPATNTFQLITDDTHKAQFPGVNGYGDLTNQKEAQAVFVGRQVMPLPGDPVPGQHDLYALAVSAMSDDGRVVAAYALSSHSDPGLAFKSFIWRCR